MPDGQQVIYSATVTSTSGVTAPTGTVTIVSGSTPLCIVTLTGGTGSCASSSAPLGADWVVGNYSGDELLPPPGRSCWT